MEPVRARNPVSVVLTISNVRGGAVGTVTATNASSADRDGVQWKRSPGRIGPEAVVAVATVAPSAPLAELPSSLPPSSAKLNENECPAMTDQQIEECDFACHFGGQK